MLYHLAPCPLNQKKQKQKSYHREDQIVASHSIFIGGREKAPHVFIFPLLYARVRSIQQTQPYFRHANNIH